MNEKYDPQAVEAAAQAHWRESDAYRARENDPRFPKGKFYVCSMLPYPSGKLHMGHVRNYTLNDVLYRILRMRGHNVMTPMGWDAFGLPAENAAIEKKIAPAEWTRANIADMKSQMQPLGLAFDWSRELATCDPAYYKWNQWMFLKMLEAGIAYRKTQVVNWDPVDQTVLANEQVIEGRGWRSGAIVEKREIPGYYLAITKYADELLNDLNQLDGWPEKVRVMQENWIGKSVGVNFGFPYDLNASDSWRSSPPSPSTGAEAGFREAKRRAAGATGAYERLATTEGGDGSRQFAAAPHPHPNPPLEGEGANSAGKTLPAKGMLRVFTTRADTLMGVTFVAVAAEHPLATHLARTRPDLAAFIDECKRGGTAEVDLATMDKKGMATGFFVEHPLSGEKVEIWIGNYVLMGYGEGAVMGVPGHDERDFAFAKKYGLPIKQVIDWPSKIPPSPPLQNGGDNNPDANARGSAQPPFTKGADAPGAARGFADAWQDWYADKQHGVCINSGKYDGLGYDAATDAIAADLKARGLGDKQVQWRLRDWGISRQRYWGTPIPIIHCESCGAVPVPEKDLPVMLPEHLVPDGSGNPLAKDERFLRCACPTCGKPARRETDTMDTFVDSAWYYMRYCSPGAETMVDARNDYWMPMDQYIGGIEHAVLHLLYARFWTKVMRDLGLVKFDEPFLRLFTQGMLLHECFYREEPNGARRWFYPNEVDVKYDERGRPVGATAKVDGLAVELGGIEKMSKSKNNVVEPKEVINKFGADTARAFVMFAGPPDQSAAWSDSGAEGVYRFLRRLWNFGFGFNVDIGRHGFALGELHALNLSDVLRDTNQRKARREVHQILQQADFDYSRMQYNTVVSAAMKMLNVLTSDAFANIGVNLPGVEDVGPDADRKLEHVRKHEQEIRYSLAAECLSILLRTLYPIAPHITDALWNELGFAAEFGEILNTPWPKADEAALAQDEIQLVVQVNGKLRGHIAVPRWADEREIEFAALGDANVQRFVAGQEVKRVVVAPKIPPFKLVNLVV